MAIINLLPSKSKRPRGGKDTDLKLSFSKASSPSNAPSLSVILLLVLSVIIILFLLGTLFVFTNQVNNKAGELDLLTQKTKNLNLEYQEIEKLNKRKRELTEMLSFYEGIFQNKVMWSEKLYLINKYMPSQMWFNNIYLDTFGAGKTISKALVIKGSVTSLLETEIIAAIAQFISRLKEDSAFNKDFVDIKLGPLQSERKGNLTLMNFSLYSKFR